MSDDAQTTEIVRLSDAERALSEFRSFMNRDLYEQTAVEGIVADRVAAARADERERLRPVFEAALTEAVEIGRAGREVHVGGMAHTYLTPPYPPVLPAEETP